MKIGNSQSAFTLIELLIVIVIMGFLSTLVTVNFQRQRQGQELMAAVNDMLSKIREVQSNLLAGKAVSGATAATAYELTLTAGAGSVQIDYFLGTNRTPLETAGLLRNTQVQQITVAGNPQSPVALRFTAPYGAITVGGTATQTVLITLQHVKSQQTRVIVIDGVSGRIGAQ